jgi:hypothetical protein
MRKLTLEDYKEGYYRYEYIRRLNTHEFSKLFNKCLEQDLEFDEEVDRLILERKNNR